MSRPWALPDSVEFFEYVGQLARARLMQPDWERRHLNHAREALKLFLHTYAFERQGSDPSYGRVAEVAVGNRGRLEGRKLWEGFNDQLKMGNPNAKPNEEVNPLFHQAGVDCGCVACFVTVNGDFHNIVLDTRDCLRGDRVRQRYEELMRIRGVAKKIAPFFLRDVAIWYEITPSQDRELLQPIDTWVRRVARRLTNRPRSSDPELQRWIIDKFSEPERANHGMWYFGAHVAGSRFRLEEGMRSRLRAEELLNEHVASLAALVETARARNDAEHQHSLSLASRGHAKRLGNESS